MTFAITGSASSSQTCLGSAPVPRPGNEFAGDQVHGVAGATAATAPAAPTIPPAFSSLRLLSASIVPVPILVEAHPSAMYQCDNLRNLVSLRTIV
ncbi:hypothetical protein [Gordonia paraffinivorans]|uniref:hypothetical protein n=1 Tax=Gordonia paraffinivorans TaxID=175628 RepID=UPI003C6D03DA